MGHVIFLTFQQKRNIKYLSVDSIIYTYTVEYYYIHINIKLGKIIFLKIKLL